MIKKLCIPLLFSLKIISSDLDPNNCLTCYASSCLLGCSAITTYHLGADLCIKGSVIGCSAAVCKAGESCHENCVYNFDPNNSFDATCAKTSGAITTISCVNCLLYGQFPTYLPFVTLILSQNLLKVAEESMTNSLSAPYNQHKNKQQRSGKKFDEMQ